MRNSSPSAESGEAICSIELRTSSSPDVETGRTSAARRSRSPEARRPGARARRSRRAGSSAERARRARGRRSPPRTGARDRGRGPRPRAPARRRLRPQCPPACAGGGRSARSAPRLGSRSSSECRSASGDRRRSTRRIQRPWRRSNTLSRVRRLEPVHRRRRGHDRRQRRRARPADLRRARGALGLAADAAERGLSSQSSSSSSAYGSPPIGRGRGDSSERLEHLRLRRRSWRLSSREYARTRRCFASCACSASSASCGCCPTCACSCSASGEAFLRSPRSPR